ncbi:hypothetical protein [Cupriavidus sp. SW-Y-13]|uniref:hypothetical protein n=1 Tax=Cupriavidus sp. SW-Y-13 TaxID=2653854 RepID=UPI001F43218C|nr:hypothetical protein [Cupriavidus sp. SW-Y-13]
MTPISGDPCSFVTSVGGGKIILVSRSGVALVYDTPTLTSLPTLMVPRQELALADLTGDWNALGFERDDATVPFVPTRIKFTLGADGKFQAGADCTGVDNCEAWQPNELPVLTVNPRGGFTLTDSNGTSALVAFKDIDGTVMAVITHGNGLIVATKQVVRPLPAVGKKNAFWDIAVFGALNYVYAKDETEIKSVDNSTNIYTRERASDKRIDTYVQNQPNAGLRYRPKDSGSNAREAVSMVVGNTGLSFLISLDQTSLFYDIAVDRP